MKKKLKIAASVFGGGILLAAVLPFVLPQNTYKNWCVGQVEELLPIDIEIDQFRLQFLPFPSLKLGGVHLSSKKTPFTSERLMDADEMKVSIDLKNLFAKQVVARFTFKKPVVYYRTAGEKSNFQNLVVPDEKKEEKSSSSWQLRVASFSIEEGVLRTWRQGAKTPDSTIHEIDLSIKNLFFGAVSKIPFSLSLLPFGDDRRFSMKGDFTLDADKEKLATKNLKIRFNDFSGTGELRSSVKTFATSGVIQTDSWKYGDHALKNIRMVFDFEPPQLNIRSLTGDVFNTQAQGKGRVIFAKPVNYELDFDLEKVDLGQLSFLKGQVVGIGSLKTTLFGRVLPGRSAVRDFSANGEIRVTEGAVPSLKLGEEIFGHSVWDILTPLAGFNKQALASLKSLDARVEQLLIPFEVRDGVAKITDGRWEHPRYHIRLNGNITLDKQLAGSGAFVLPPAEVNQLVEEPAVRKYLTDSGGNLVLPFFVSGRLDKPQVTPDKKTLVPRFTKAVAARGVESIKNEIGNILIPQGEGESTTDKKSLPGILKGIFGK